MAQTQTPKPIGYSYHVFYNEKKNIAIAKIGTRYFVFVPWHPVRIYKKLRDALRAIYPWMNKFYIDFRKRELVVKYEEPFIDSEGVLVDYVDREDRFVIYY